MSRFKLIEIEKSPSGSFPCYADLNPERETIFIVYKSESDQYGNGHFRKIFITDCVESAKKFLRSCRLIEGIEIE